MSANSLQLLGLFNQRMCHKGRQGLYRPLTRKCEMCHKQT